MAPLSNLHKAYQNKLQALKKVMLNWLSNNWHINTRSNFFEFKKILSQVHIPMIPTYLIYILPSNRESKIEHK